MCSNGQLPICATMLSENVMMDKIKMMSLKSLKSKSTIYLVCYIRFHRWVILFYTCKISHYPGGVQSTGMMRHVGAVILPTRLKLSPPNLLKLL